MCLETGSVYGKKAISAMATPNSQTSDVKSLVFTVLKGYLNVLQKGSLKRSLKIPNSLSASQLRITLQKSYLTEHCGNIQGVIVKDYGRF